MKLIINISLILTGLILICPHHTFARQSGEPTDVIIRKIQQHLPEQNPSHYGSYSAIIFHKFLIKNILFPAKEELTNDTTAHTFDHTNKTDLFATEILSALKILKPAYYQTENLSSKISGKDQNGFGGLDSALTDFSLLHPKNNFLNKIWSSPFAETAFHQYNYSLKDSVLPGGETIYRITFQPSPDHHSDAFNGTALIDAKDYSIRQINAWFKQNNSTDPIITINQNFEQLSGTWFPSETKIRVYFTREAGKNQNEKVHLMAESITTIYQQQINPPLGSADFKDSLSQIKTDSALIAFQQRRLKMIRLMAEGKISLGWFDLDYNRIFGYNLYEGIKIGLGAETNSRLSNHFTVGGYLSYGLKDQSVRHGEWINIYPTGRSDLRFHMSYKDMNLEFGGPEFPETKSLFNPESYRSLLIKNMYESRRYTAGLEFRPLSELNLYLFGDHSENSSGPNTPFLSDHPFNPISLTRAGMQLRFSPGEKSQPDDRGLNGTLAPKANFSVTMIQGLPILSGEYRYTKLEVKGKFNLQFARPGTTTIMVRGGILSKKAPIIELFNGYGSFAGTFSLAAPYSFATMQLNEFAASGYSAVHLRHDFSTWLFPETYKFKPAIIFAQNIGIGRLNDQLQTAFNLRDYRKGFYESGFEINNLLRMNYLSWGIGIYYRYGPYQFSSIHENFAYKFGFYFQL